MHPEDAYKKAEEANQKGYDESKAIRQPWINQGQEAGGDLMAMLKKFMNPGQLENEWSQGYETSPYAKQLQSQAQSGGMDAASAMGLGGSSAALNNIQQTSGNIMQGDRQNYMNDLMQKYMQAMGIGQNMYGTGAGMAGQGAQGAQQFGQDQSGLEYNKNAAQGNMFGNMVGGAAALGGTILGGPIGGAFGQYVGQKLGNKPDAYGRYS